MHDLGSMALAQEEHRAILDACCRRDAEEAAMLVEKHVTEVGQAIIEFVRKRYEGYKP
jgi:DNA-binding GntR family transcriptional regulator